MLQIQAALKSVKPMKTKKSGMARSAKTSCVIPVFTLPALSEPNPGRSTLRISAATARPFVTLCFFIFSFITLFLEQRI